jgi:hypothetical protein
MISPGFSSITDFRHLSKSRAEFLVKTTASSKQAIQLKYKGGQSTPNAG